MEHAVISCLQADSSGLATARTVNTVHSEATHRLAPAGSPFLSSFPASPLRQTRVLAHALCEMRLELTDGREGWSPATLASRRTTTMALWRNRPREIFTQTEIEQGIEARLESGFLRAGDGSRREAAAEFKRAYLLLCCVLTHARDMARRASAPSRKNVPQPAHPPRPDAPLDRGA